MNHGISLSSALNHGIYIHLYIYILINIYIYLYITVQYFKQIIDQPAQPEID